MPFFDHDGIKFHYRDEGVGLPFIFQHGLGGDSAQPFGLYEPPPGVRLLAFDTRAHGQTHPTSEHDKLGFEIFGGDLHAFLEHLGLSQAVVGGISMGAGIALNFILRYPERALGLVLSRPAWLEEPCPWNVRMFNLITLLIREKGRVAGKQAFRQSEEYLETRRQWPEVAEAMAAQFDEPDIEETAFKFECIINDVPNRDRTAWATIRVPTLVMANRGDPVHPYEYGEVLSEIIPRAQLRDLTPKSESLEQHTADLQRHIDEFLATYFLAENRSNVC